MSDTRQDQHEETGPADRDAPTPHVVVGVDGSDHSRNTFAWAAYLAGQCGADLDVVLVWEPEAAHGYRVLGVDPSPHMRRELDSVIGTDRPPWLHPHTEVGDAATVLRKFSRTATMLVIGHSAGHALTLAHDALHARLTSRENCPVVLVGTTPPPALADAARVPQAAAR